MFNILVMSTQSLYRIGNNFSLIDLLSDGGFSYSAMFFSLCIELDFILSILLLLLLLLLFLFLLIDPYFTILT